MTKMTTKKWTIGFVFLIILSLLFIAGANYCIDPYGYFSAQKGENYSMDERIPENSLSTSPPRRLPSLTGRQRETFMKFRQL